MKKITLIAVIMLIVSAVLPFQVQAAVFSNDLYYGLENNSEVKELQALLTNLNLYTGPITGNFTASTQTSVKAFQREYNLPVTGYFGPLSRIQANFIAGASNNDNTATLSLISPVGSESFTSGNTANITWQSSHYPANGRVNINLLKKVSDNPATYELDHVIAQNTPNDGVEAWNVEAKNGDNYFIEVTCAGDSFINGCRGVNTKSSLAINDNGLNLANPTSFFGKISNFFKGLLK